MVVDGVKGAIYSEIVNLKLGNGEMRRGQVLEVDGDRAVVQVRVWRGGAGHTGVCCGARLCTFAARRGWARKCLRATSGLCLFLAEALRGGLRRGWPPPLQTAVLPAHTARLHTTCVCAPLAGEEGGVVHPHPTLSALSWRPY